MITGIYVQEETTTICFGLWASAWLVLVKLVRGVHPMTFSDNDHGVSELSRILLSSHV